MVITANKLKEALLNKTAETLQQDVDVVEEVISWMFKDVLKHVRTTREIELSGFGMFILSNAKMRRRVIEGEKIKGRLLAKPWSENIQMKLDSTNSNLRYYYEKLGMEEDLGRLSQPTHSPEGNTAASGEDSGGEVGDMQELP